MSVYILTVSSVTVIYVLVVTGGEIVMVLFMLCKFV